MSFRVHSRKSNIVEMVVIDVRSSPVPLFEEVIHSNDLFEDILLRFHVSQKYSPFVGSKMSFASSAGESSLQSLTSPSRNFNSS